MDQLEINSDIGSIIKPLTLSLSKFNFNLYPDASLKTTQKQSETKRHLCSFSNCFKSFGKKSRLLVHERIHTGDRPFKCHYENCDKQYTRNFHLTRHIAVSHSLVDSTINEELRCDVCEKPFSNIYSLKKHKAILHDSSRYRCDECGLHFRKQNGLKSHSYIHTGIKPFKCDHEGCESSFVFMSKLKRHRQSHERSRYPCPHLDCSETFDVYAQLRKHLASDHPKHCDICDAKFSQISQLKSHLKTHDNFREAFFCPITLCERYYLEERNLRKHILEKHDENFKGFECHICSRNLVSKQKLNQHLETHDPLRIKVCKPKMPRRSRKDKGTKKTAKTLSGYTKPFRNRIVCENDETEKISDEDSVE